MLMFTIWGQGQHVTGNYRPYSLSHKQKLKNKMFGNNWTKQRLSLKQDLCLLKPVVLSGVRFTVLCSNMDSALVLAKKGAFKKKG